MSRYVEFYGTLPDGTAGPALVYGFPSGGTLLLAQTGDTASSFTITLPLITGTALVYTALSSSTDNVVTNKVKINISGTDYYLLATTSGA